MDTTSYIVQVWLALIGVFVIMESVAQASQVKGIHGRSAKLPCSTDIRDPGMIVKWLDPEQRDLSENYRVYDEQRYHISNTYLGEWNLEIKSVKQSDRGNYTCRIFTNPNIVRTVELIVLEAPRLITKSPDQKLNTGESLQLFCNFSGVPAPVIKWFQQDYSGKRVELSSEGESISISSATKLNGGIYECNADNGITPSFSAKINVTVNFKPEISAAFREIGLQRGQETMISCFVETSPADRMFWKKDGLELKDGGNYKTHRWSINQNHYTLALIISNFNDSDYGDYNCVAENSLGQASEKTTVHQYHAGRIQIVSPPREAMVRVGSGVQLDCTVLGLADGDSLTWWRKTAKSLNYERLFVSHPNSDKASQATNFNRNLYEMRGHYNLFIKAVTLDDGGQYLCEVSGHQNLSAELTVLGGVTCDPTHSTVDSGQVESLKCSVTYGGNTPHLKVEWSYDGKTLSSLTEDQTSLIQRKLVLTAYHPESSGTYLCSVSSRLTNFTETCSTNLTVMASNVTLAPLPICQEGPMASTTLVVIIIIFSVIVIVMVVTIGCLITHFQRKLQSHARFSDISGSNGETNVELKLLKECEASKSHDV